MNNTKWACIDFETSVDNTGDSAVGKFSGTPFAPQNKIVSAGILNNLGTYTAFYHSNYTKPLGAVVFEYLWEFFYKDSTAYKMYLVGHNIKFDLHYLQKEYLNSGKPSFAQRQNRCDQYMKFFAKIALRDTQLTAYLLSGQAHLYPKLNDLIKQYGGKLKDSQIELFWKDGIRTEDIPEKQLLDYMKNDVLQTARIFQKQEQEIDSRPIRALVASQSDALLAYQTMEFNGLCMNVQKALKKAALLQEALEKKTKILNEILQQTLQIQVPNCNSAQQLSVFLFGGSLEERVSVPLLDDNGKQKVFLSGLKKGQPRTKKELVKRTHTGFVTPDPATETKRRGIYSTGIQILQKLIKSSNLPADVRKFLKTYLQNRELTKELSTYYIGYINLTWEDGFIHHNLNNCATATGRLSSSAPNMQNLKSRDGDI